MSPAGAGRHQKWTSEEAAMSAGFTTDGIKRLEEIVGGHVDDGGVVGVSWLVARRGEVHHGVAGTLDAGGGPRVAEDTIFRISSMTKPVTAIAALILVDECTLRLDEPVDRWLPELADRQVLARPGGPLDETVPARRPVTLRDLLTFRLGWGMDFSFSTPQPVLEAMAELGLGVGPPRPAGPPEPDEWMRLVSPLPLEYQPGTKWLYHTSADVLGVLVARAAGQPLGTVMRERIFEPLGMRDTGFAVPAAHLARFGPCYWNDPASGGRAVFDPADGEWSRPPAFPSGGAGLVSTLVDYHAFAELLMGRGSYRGERLVSRAAVETMTTDQLTDAQREASVVDLRGDLGWGFGVGVHVRRTRPTASVGTYGWDGGLGTSWHNDPAEDLTGIVLTNQTWSSPSPSPVCDDFWTATYTAFAD
jgi:CubicO group peptidase (beta-lactamase class C family)